MAKSSCSHWWHAPAYFTVSVTLAFLAISTPQPQHSDLKNAPITHHRHLFLSNASRALRRSGFTAVATLLQVSPELFFLPDSPQRHSTIFAIKDSAISDFSLPPWLLKHLFQYHTSPSELSIRDLLEKPRGSCLSTLLENKEVAITKVDAAEGAVEINGVLVSHPDVFHGGPISVHGVLGPFSPLTNPQDFQESQWGFIQTPTICGSMLGNFLEWPKIIRTLSSTGFVSFAVGLHAVLGGVSRDFTNLSSVTVFAPPDLALAASPSPMLDRIVRFHILPRRISYAELAALPQKAKIGTLLHHRDLEVSGRVKNSSRNLAVNGVEVLAPDVFSSKKFIVHGISRAFDLRELPDSF